jgi:TATA-box binding protein (TBP) (component of TFIID and TFIIIB)
MNNKSKIINDYVSVIHSKEKLHKSDIVMSVNLINKYRLSKHDSNFVYDVFRRYFGESFPNVLLKMKAEELASEQKKKR